MTTPLHDKQAVVFYALAIQGRIISAKFSERFAAEMARQALPPDQQKLAEVVTVDSSSRQLLLG